MGSERLLSTLTRQAITVSIATKAGESLVLQSNAGEVVPVSVRARLWEMMQVKASEFAQRLDKKQNGPIENVSSTKEADLQLILSQTGDEMGYVRADQGDVFVYLYEEAVIDDAFLQKYLPFHTLEIHAPLATLVLEGRLKVSGCCRILCKDLKLGLSAAICAQELVVSSKEALVLPADFVLEAGDAVLSAGKSMKIDSTLNLATLHLESEGEIELSQKAVLTSKEATLRGQSIAVYGQLESLKTVKFEAEDDIAFRTGSRVSSIKIEAKAKQMECLGELTCDDVAFQASKVILAGKVKSRPPIEAAEVENAPIPTIATSSSSPETSPPVLSIEANALDIDACIETDSLLHFNANKIFLSKRAQVKPLSPHAKPSSKYASQINCQERLYVADGAFVETPHPLKLVTKDLSLYGSIKAKGNLHAEVNGKGEIHDHGVLSGGQHVNLEGSCCWNSGLVEAKELLHLSFDKFFINGICDLNPLEKIKAGELLGKLSAKNVTINTAFFLGVLSHIQAENTVQVNAFVDIYIGLINAKHISHSNILVLDLGFNITVIETIKSVIGFIREVVEVANSPEKTLKSVIDKHLESVDTQTMAMSGASYALQAAGIAAKLLTVFAPQIGIPANIILGSINLLLQLALNGYSVKQEVTKLIERYQSGKAIYPRHVYPLILNIKSIGMAGANLITMGVGMPDILTHLPDQIKHSHENLTSVLPNVAGILGGSVTSQSVVTIQGIGATVTGLQSATSAIHVSALHQTVSSVSFENSFMSEHVYSDIVSAMRNIATTTFQETGGVQAVETETITATKADLSGHTQAHHATVIAHDLAQSNTLAATTAVIQAEKAVILGDVKVEGGMILAHQLDLAASSQVRLSTVDVKVGELSSASEMQAQGCSIRAEKVTFSDKSQTVLKETVVEAAIVHQEKEALLETDQVLMQSHETLLDGKTKVDHELAFVADALTFSASSAIEKGEHSRVVLEAKMLEKQGSLETDTLVFKGNLDSQTVNAYGTDKTVHVNTMVIASSQGVKITESFTAADNFYVIGASVEENAPQHAESFVVESTQGDVSVNQAMTMTGTLGLISAGKVVIHADLQAGHIEAYSTGELVVERPLETQEELSKRIHFSPGHLLEKCLLGRHLAFPKAFITGNIPPSRLPLPGRLPFLRSR